MRRFELIEGTANKFWEVATEAAALTVRYGRIGASGQVQTKALGSAEKATAEAEKLILEKTRKGYVEIAVARTARPSPAAPKAAKAAKATATATATRPPTSAPTGTVRWTDEAREQLIPRRGQKAPDGAGMPKKKLLLALDAAANEKSGYGANETVYRWKQLRVALAAASDRDYDEALEVARARWPTLTDLVPRCALAYVFPSETGWTSAATGELLAYYKKEKGKFGAAEAGIALLGAVSDPALSVALARACASKRIAIYALTEQVWSMIDLIGAEAVPGLAALLDNAPSNRHRQLYASALALIETPEAAYVLASTLGSKASAAIATEYLRRLPALAIPALAQVAKKTVSAAAVASQLLQELGGPSAPTNPDPPGKPAKAAGKDDLPRVLAEPPWLSKARRREPADIELVTLARPTALAWGPGERERSAGNTYTGSKREIEGHLREIEKLVKEHPGPSVNAHIDSWWYAVRFTDAALLEAWKRFPKVIWRSNTATLLLARLGDAILPEFIDYALSLRQPTTSRVLLPVVGPRVAQIMADGLAGSRSRADAERWLKMNPEMAAVGLIPVAVGRSKERGNAGAALRFLVAKGHADVIARVAREYGKPATQALDEVLAFDPTESFPAKLPALPAFFTPARLPPLLLADGMRPVPADAIGHLATMLAFSSPDDPYAGLAQVKAACDPTSLEAFAWSLFEAWLAAGGPAKEQWAFVALGHLGGDGVARRLTPLVRAWPGESLHSRAVLGLEVLAMIGTDLALMHLHGVAQKLKFKGLQERAQEKIAQIAEARGLTVDELSDRLVPDLDLDEGGSRSLDFGPRQFRVGFDETLRPVIRDAQGKQLAELPMPAKNDDAVKARTAIEAFKLLKKDAKQVISAQVTRLERAMCSRRRWDGATFELLLLKHPLMRHLIQTLIWTTFGEKNGKVESTFRVAEDGTLADVQDAARSLDGRASVGIAHVLDLDAKAVDAWSRIFADYKILQPFPQLSRQTYAPAKDEKKSLSLSRASGATVPTGRVLGLLARGWRKGPPQDAGWIWEWHKPLPGYEDPAILVLETGIPAGGAADEPQQKLGALKLPVAAGELDAVCFSELVADVVGLTAPV